MFVDAPGKPGKPKVERIDEDSISLTWTKPFDDGGDAAVVPGVRPPAAQLKGEGRNYKLVA